MEQRLAGQTCQLEKFKVKIQVHTDWLSDKQGSILFLCHN